MTVLLTFALLAVTLFVLFWAGALVAQGYLYQQPADQLPARAGAAALLVAGFLTFWVWLDKRAPGKYDTFFEFAPYTTAAFGEFEAVRWRNDPAAKAFKKDEAGKTAERTTTFKRRAGGKTAAFAEEGTGQPFQLGTADELTAALLVKAGDGPPVRFDAELKADPKTGRPTYFGEKRFVEAGGDRYVRGDQLGVLYVPSNAVVVASLALNLLLFVVFFAAFWPGLRFELWHAVGLAVVFGLVTMLLVMPMLFKPNRTPRPAPEVGYTPPPPSKTQSV
ncbi:MAG: hypothetical protein K2X87_23905 [Gemmataceae bacterium]|nr:hypothetical protein [Gemmataceae bacterium]